MLIKNTIQYAKEILKDKGELKILSKNTQLLDELLFDKNDDDKGYKITSVFSSQFNIFPNIKHLIKHLKSVPQEFIIRYFKESDSSNKDKIILLEKMNILYKKSIIIYILEKSFESLPKEIFNECINNYGFNKEDLLGFKNSKELIGEEIFFNSSDTLTSNPYLNIQDIEKIIEEKNKGMFFRDNDFGTMLEKNIDPNVIIHFIKKGHKQDNKYKNFLNDPVKNKDGFIMYYPSNPFKNFDIQKYKYLNQDIVNEFPDMISFKNIDFEVTEDFILKNYKKLNMEDIAKNNKLSEDFIVKFLDNIDEENKKIEYYKIAFLRKSNLKFSSFKKISSKLKLEMGYEEILTLANRKKFDEKSLNREIQYLHNEIEELESEVLEQLREDFKIQNKKEKITKLLIASLKCNLPDNFIEDNLKIFLKYNKKNNILTELINKHHLTMDCFTEEFVSKINKGDYFLVLSIYSKQDFDLLKEEKPDIWKLWQNKCKIIMDENYNGNRKLYDKRIKDNKSENLIHLNKSDNDKIRNYIDNLEPNWLLGSEAFLLTLFLSKNEILDNRIKAENEQNSNKEIRSLNDNIFI